MASFGAKRVCSRCPSFCRLAEIFVIILMFAGVCYLMVVFPDWQKYLSIALVVLVVYGLRLWRFLPSERRRVSREAHKLADAKLIARMSTVAALPVGAPPLLTADSRADTAPSPLPLPCGWGGGNILPQNVRVFATRTHFG